MSTVASLFAQLQAELRETRGVDPLRELAARLVDPAQHADLSVKERLDLAFTALRRLFDATAGDVEAAETALQQLLVPLCIGSALPPAADAETEQYHLRGLLESWLKGCSQDRFETVRAAILQRAVEMLGQGDPQQAAWTISRIGYRDDGIVNALLEAAERCDHEGMDPEVGSVMLDVAVRLGVPAEERQRIIDAVRARARRGFSWGLATAILWLADEELVTEYFAEWVSAAAEHPRAGLGQLARWPSEVAAKSPGDVDLQSRMWALLETALEPEPGDVVADAFYGSDLSSQVNHPGVVAALLRWLGGRRGDDHVRSRQ
ncbi:MAG: hypothetical protein HYU66_14725, partial [Armatimonadetes bacterium]|nr:hypothetical protein [Armatimonadota bacterium]